MKLLVTLETDETGMIVAECPAVPGCVSLKGTLRPRRWRTFVRRPWGAWKPGRLTACR